MEDKLSIKLHIANRIYPMKIERSSEEYMRSAVKKIEGRLRFYEENKCNTFPTHPIVISFVLDKLSKGIDY